MLWAFGVYSARPLRLARSSGGPSLAPDEPRVRPASPNPPTPQIEQACVSAKLDDGPFSVEEIDGQQVIRPENLYLYFQVHESFAYDLAADPGQRMVVELTLLDLGAGPIDVEYDGHAKEYGPGYVPSAKHKLTGSGEPSTVRFELPHARFANRKNGWSDFRIRRFGPLDAKIFALQKISLRCVPAPGPPYVPKGKLTYIDLQPKANKKLVQGTPTFADNTLDSLPRGEQTFGGVRFMIGDGLIQLGSTRRPDRPEKVDGIAINRAFERLYVFHATEYGTFPNVVPDGTPIGKYQVNYEDDITETIPIVYGQDVRNWWNGDGSRDVTRGHVAWKGSNPAAKGRNQTLRRYLGVWENPRPHKKVLTIDYASTNDTAAPFCVAMTVEANAALETRPPKTDPDSWPQ